MLAGRVRRSDRGREASGSELAERRRKPQRSAACDLDDAIGPTVPEADPVALPDDFAIFEDGGELFVGLAFDRPAAAAFRCDGGK